MPRAKIEITDEAIALIEQYARHGATLTNIAILLDISDSTLDRWMKHPQVARAYKRGRLLANDEIAGLLFEQAKQGNIAAIIFYLKSQAGWREQPEEAIAQSGQVTIYLPKRDED
jgi:transposase-like protein